MKTVVLACSFFILLLASFNCKSPTAPNGRGIRLTVADVSCTEAWLNLTASNVAFPVNLTIKSGSSVLFNSSISSSDSLIYIDSLLPNQTYTLQGYITTNNKQYTINQLTLKTMATTSSNFTWQLFTLGNYLTGNSSILYDVAIINDTSAWTVGEIYTNDSTGMYNAVHWDGKNCNVHKIPYFYQGQTFYHSIKSVLAFGSNNIFFCGNGVIYWDGTKYNPFSIPTSVWGPYQMNKLWGVNNQSVYVAGNGGNIIFYNGQTWEKQESGTNFDLYDIYSNDGKTIYASGGNFSNYDGVLLKGNNNWQTIKEGKIINSNELFNPYFAGIAKTVWVSSNNTVYFGGNLLYRYKLGQFELVKSLQGNYINGDVNGQYFGFISQIRGNGDNDIVMVGEGNTIRHFNGVRWNQLGMPYNYSSDYTWLAVSMKGNLIIAVGYSSTNAIIIVLKRQ